MRLAIVFVTLISSGAACACTAEIDLAAPLEARRVTPQRAYFHRTLEAPPPGAVAPTRGAFVVAGDVVLVAGRTGAHACAHYVNRAGLQTSGWLPVSVLADAAPAREADWAGRWTSGPEKTVTITARGEALDLDGSATYGASDRERAARGAVSIGDIGARFTPRGPDAAFTITTAGNATLPFDSGDPSDCRLRLARRGPYLVIWDNLACGGANVTFRGIYRR